MLLLNNSENFSFFELAESVLKRWWNILILVVLASVVTYFYTDIAITPMYSARGTLYITVDASSDKIDSMVSSVDYSNIMSARELTKTYMQILSSRTFYESVLAESGLDYSVADLSGMVSYSNKSETLIIQTTATAPKPDDAAEIVETVLNCSQGEISRVVSGGSVKIIDHPTKPTKPSYPNYKKNILVAIIIGMLLGIVLNILIEFFDDSIKSLDSFSDKYSIPILGEIPNITSHNIPGSGSYAYESTKPAHKK